MAWLVLALPQAGAQVLRAYTEDWPPYSFPEQGQLHGIAVDLLREMAAQAGVEVSIELMPWKRAYLTAQEQEHALVFLTVRRPEREALFHWVGPALPRQLWVFGRPGAQSVRQPEQLAGRLAAVRGDAAAEELVQRGFPARQIDYGVDVPNAIRKFLAGRVDYFYATELSARWTLRQLGSELLPSKLYLIDDGGYYFAMNRRMAPKTVAALQNALERLQRQGRVQALVQHYLSTLRPAR